MVSNEFNLAASVALLLYLQGGVITSETQRLKKTSVFPNASVPFLLIESETKTEARKRVVPITVANSWIKEALEKLEDTSDMALGNDWCALTESGAHKRLDRILPDGVSPYGLRHSFRANAIASDAGDNAAIIGGWKSSNGLSPIMFNYGQDAFCRTETLKGLERTSKKINQHLIEALN